MAAIKPVIKHPADKKPASTQNRHPFSYNFKAPASDKLTKIINDAIPLIQNICDWDWWKEKEEIHFSISYNDTSLIRADEQAKGKFLQDVPAKNKVMADAMQKVLDEFFTKIILLKPTEDKRGLRITESGFIILELDAFTERADDLLRLHEIHNAFVKTGQSQKLEFDSRFILDRFTPHISIGRINTDVLAKTKDKRSRDEKEKDRRELVRKAELDLAKHKDDIMNVLRKAIHLVNIYDLRLSYTDENGKELILAASKEIPRLEFGVRSLVKTRNDLKVNVFCHTKVDLKKFQEFLKSIEIEKGVLTEEHHNLLKLSGHYYYAISGIINRCVHTVNVPWGEVRDGMPMPMAKPEPIDVLPQFQKHQEKRERYARQEHHDRQELRLGKKQEKPRGEGREIWFETLSGAGSKSSGGKTNRKFS